MNGFQFRPHQYADLTLNSPPEAACEVLCAKLEVWLSADNVACPKFFTSASELLFVDEVIAAIAEVYTRGGAVYNDDAKADVFDLGTCFFPICGGYSEELLGKRFIELFSTFNFDVVPAISSSDEGLAVQVLVKNTQACFYPVEIQEIRIPMLLRFYKYIVDAYANDGILSSNSAKQAIGINNSTINNKVEEWLNAGYLSPIQEEARKRYKITPHLARELTLKIKRFKNEVKQTF